MKRRNVLIGMGSLAAGSAVTMGTGAFTQVEARRNLTVETARDADAFLALSELDSPNSDQFVDASGGRSNTLSITIDETDAGGTGVNEQAEIFFDDLFRIRNQGTQAAWVWIRSNTRGVGFYKGDQEVSISTDRGNIGPRPTIQYLTVGESIDVGMSINTVGTPNDRDSQIEVVAEADESDVPDNNGLSVENSDKGV